PSRRSTTRRASHACTSRGQARRRGGVSGTASLELCLAEQERQKELDAQAKTPSTRVEVPSVGIRLKIPAARASVANDRPRLLAAKRITEQALLHRRWHPPPSDPGERMGHVQVPTIEHVAFLHGALAPRASDVCLGHCITPKLPTHS